MSLVCCFNHPEVGLLAVNGIYFRMANAKLLNCGLSMRRVIGLIPPNLKDSKSVAYRLYSKETFNSFGLFDLIFDPRILPPEEMLVH